MSAALDFTPAEIMVVCMARQVEDGEIVAQGIATPLVAAAYLLARHTHAPNLYFASAIGQGICKQPAPLGISNIESFWLDHALTNVGFARAAADVLPNLRPKEFFRPGQIDMHGNFNNIAFGSDYAQPRLRLPGSGGIPDVTTFISDIYLYIPRHSRVSFVPKLDFLSGMGHSSARTMGDGPQYLVTDLGQFDFKKGRMHLTSFHPGTSIERIQAKTKFELVIANEVHETHPPSPEELRLIREIIDPLGIRNLELLSGAARRKQLRDILVAERAIM
ncbi:MAG: ketoacid-CoA transferase [Anaerolineales bacterium]|nr:ketoacid-CoA transferase [Chloroflexota bacterium]MBL6982287.1 ketoacid-CoA transferase [Anaerolineales bacterium]